MLEDAWLDNMKLQKHADRLEDQLAVDARLHSKMEGETEFANAATKCLSNLLNERMIRLTESKEKSRVKHNSDKAKMNIKLAEVRNDRDMKVAVMRAEISSSIAAVKKQGEKDVLEAPADGERKCVMITANYDTALLDGDKKLAKV